mmetsp:Transcript_32311/g.48801  ORF Transcript_32311/g.48801 Transcript_32311/m.48801 type:complete len:590 (-) Transcript_32311:115-1884(-)
MMNYQFDALAARVKLKDITSCADNRALLHRIKNNDPGLRTLAVLDEPEDEDEFIVREGDDLGWLGYFIGRNEKLKYLSVCYLPGDRERGVKFFFGMQRNKSIKGVDICNHLNESLSVMNLPHVTSMSFECQLEGEYAHYFALGLRRCTSLKEYSGQLTAGIVESLTTLPILEKVHVWKNGGLAISREECMALRELLLNANKLKHLDLSGVGLGNDGLRLLAEGLACYSSLADGVLDLSRNDIGDEGLQALASSLASNAKLRELNLCNNNFGDKGLEALAESLAHNRALRVLSIAANTAITKIGVRAISRILQSSKSRLEDLRLDRIYICEEGGKILGDALSINESLVSLSLRCWGNDDVSIGDDGLKALAHGLSRNSHLKELDLSRNTAITATGLRSLKQYFRSPSCALENLTLYDINFGDKGAYALAYALRENKSLKFLYFDDRGITSKGWKAFLKLICNSSSPNGIYLSNHTLSLLSWCDNRAGRVVKKKILNCLAINKKCDAQNAAKFKIMYLFLDLDMVPLFQWNLKFLPLVKSWFDTITAPNDDFVASIRNRKLSATYKFVKGMPALIVSVFRHSDSAALENQR